MQRYKIKIVFKTLLIIFLFVIVCYVFGVNIEKFFGEKNVSKSEVIHVACVGDSNTFRHGGKQVADYKYPSILADLLGGNYYVKNYGEVGACVNREGNYPYRSLRVSDASIEDEADILIIMLGTNDVWEHNWVSEEKFKEEYLELVECYLMKENVPEIYLCTIPKLYKEDGKTLETGDGERVEIISNIIRDVAKEQDCGIIEINRATENHPEWYESDLLHLNKDGARGVAEVIKEVIENREEY